MSKRRGYHPAPFTANRRILAASVSVNNERNIIHGITEIDVSVPRRILRDHHRATGEKLSFTAFIVASLARAVVEHPALNSFRRRRKLIILDDVTISVLVEREISGENIPEPLGIRAAQSKTYRQIHDEIRSAQKNTQPRLGAFSGVTWVRFIPGFCLKMFVRIASRNISMAKKYGKIGVTAVGMFGSGAVWFVPLTAATVTVTVGSIVERPVLEEGRVVTREFLCLTISFDHDIVDGAPAARFTKRFSELLINGDVLHDVAESAA